MLNWLIYGSIAVFVLRVSYRIWELSRRIHLRCELYPIPNALERVDAQEGVRVWGKRKKISCFLGTVPEIFLINKKKMSLQPRQWLATFLFHLGIFLHIFFIFLLFVYAFFDSLSISINENFASILLAFGIFGLLLMFLFALYLFFRKLRAPIRYYVPLEDYLILSLVLIMSFTGLLSFLKFNLNNSIGFVKSIMTFSTPPEIPFFENLHITTFSILILVLPFTRIAHYIAVWFTNLVLWDNRSAEELKSELNEILKNYRVKWSAEHLDPELSWEEEVKRVKE